MPAINSRLAFACRKSKLSWMWNFGEGIGKSDSNKKEAELPIGAIQPLC